MTGITVLKFVWSSATLSKIFIAFSRNHLCDKQLDSDQARCEGLSESKKTVCRFINRHYKLAIPLADKESINFYVDNMSVICTMEF